MKKKRIPIDNETLDSLLRNFPIKKKLKCPNCKVACKLIYQGRDVPSGIDFPGRPFRPSGCRTLSQHARYICDNCTKVYYLTELRKYAK